MNGKLKKNFIRMKKKIKRGNQNVPFIIKK